MIKSLLNETTFESGIITAGADPGFGAIKVKAGDVRILYPAVICRGTDRVFSTLGEPKANEEFDLNQQIESLDVIIKDNKTGIQSHYFMGALAERLAPNESHYCWDEDRSNDDESMALLVVGLALAQNRDKANYYLGAGIPVKYYNDLSRKYETELRGSFTVTFLAGPLQGNARQVTIIRSKILPQSYGVFIKEGFGDPSGSIRRKLFNGYVTVIDPGFRTTDVATFYDGVMLDPPYSFSLERGLRWAYTSVADKLRDMTMNNDSPIETDDKELDKVFRVNNGLYPWRDNTINLRPALEKSLDQLGADISREIKKTLKPMFGKIHTILVSGKVGEMIYDRIQFENKELISLPQFGNAAGFEIAVMNIVNEVTRKSVAVSKE